MVKKLKKKQKTHLFFLCLLAQQSTPHIRLSTAWQDDPPPELLERGRLRKNEVRLPLS